MEIEVYHGSGEVVEFPEIRIGNIQKIFHGDFTAPIIVNRLKSGQEEIEKPLQLMYIH